MSVQGSRPDGSLAGGERQHSAQVWAMTGGPYAQTIQLKRPARVPVRHSQSRCVDSNSLRRSALSTPIPN